MIRLPQLILALLFASQFVQAEEPRIGEALPEISGTSVRGKEVSLKSLRGKPVLVDFWATWCGPCLAEMPNLMRIHQKFHDRGFEIVAVSLDEDREELMKYLEENDLPWPVLNAEGGWTSKWAEALSVESIPTFFLLRPDGSLASKTARGARLVEWIRHLLDPEYPLAPDVEESFVEWREASGEKRMAAEKRVLKLAGSLALVDEMNVAIWTELMRPFLSDTEVTFLLATSEKVGEAHPKKNYLDTYAYALYRSGDYAKAAEVQAEAVHAVTEEEVAADYGWLLESRLALYLARSGNLSEANRVFGSALARRDRVEQLFSERIDWLGEAADLLDRNYKETWEDEFGVDQMFYYARFEGKRDRVRKRYESLIGSLDEEERSDYAIAFGKVEWPDSMRGSLSEQSALPLDIVVRDASAGGDLVRIRKVGTDGDFAVLLDAPPAPEGEASRAGNLVLEAPGLKTVTREISIVGGKVVDLGKVELTTAE